MDEKVYNLEYNPKHAFARNMYSLKIAPGLETYDNWVQDG